MLIKNFLVTAFVILVDVSLCISQTSASKDSLACDYPPLGLFRQITDATGEVTDEYFQSKFAIDSDMYLSEDRWPIDDLDQIVPSYRFFLDRNQPEAGNATCGAIQIHGKLIAPNGKIFKFSKALYNAASRTLRFTTVHRDTIRYEGEIIFLARPVRLNTSYQDGTVKLKAFGKYLKFVSLKFPFASANSH